MAGNERKENYRRPYRNPRYKGRNENAAETAEEVKYHAVRHTLNARQVKRISSCRLIWMEAVNLILIQVSDFLTIC